MKSSNKRDNPQAMIKGKISGLYSLFVHKLRDTVVIVLDGISILVHPDGEIYKSKDYSSKIRKFRHNGPNKYNN
jgi:hypothetical protein